MTSVSDFSVRACGRRAIGVFVCLVLTLAGTAEGFCDVALVAPGAQLTKLAGGFAFTEGPACDAHGNVYFTDQPNDRILKWGTDGKISAFLQPCGRSNGLCFDAHGNLWACADAQNELWRINRAGKVTLVVRGYRRQTAQRAE